MIASALLLLAQPAPAPSSIMPTPLRPLSDVDASRATETGCQFVFGQGDDTYLFIIGRSLLMRTERGFHHCTITDAQFTGFGEGATRVPCGGRTLAVRRTGRGVSNPEADSAQGPATLTMSQGRFTRSVRGWWGSAC